MALATVRKAVLWGVAIVGVMPLNGQQNEQELVKSLGRFGVSLGSFVYTTAKDNLAQPDPSASDLQKSLDQMVHGYQSSLDAGRGTATLLDTNFEVALTGIDVSTGGSSLLATVGVRWLKNEGIAVLTRRIEQDCLNNLAANVDKFNKAADLNYDELRSKKPDEIKRALDKIGIFADTSQKLAGNAEAQRLIVNATIHDIITTSKDTLNGLAKTQIDVAGTRDEMVKLGQDFTEYTTNVNRAVQDFSTAIGQAQAEIEKANDKLDDLRTRTVNNTEQLQSLATIGFEHGDAWDRLTLLKGGYLKGILSEQDRGILIESAQAEAKKQELLNGMHQVVGQLNAIGKIASDLRISGSGDLCNCNSSCEYGR